MTKDSSASADRRLKILKRLDGDEWRTPVYYELITGEFEQFPKPITVLEIGCGRGFDNNVRLQHKMAAEVDKFVGIEPDLSVDPQPIFSDVVRRNLEDSGIEESSIDIAYSIMVMEHVEEPDAFMKALSHVLKPGGVYWGISVDSRHWFTAVANAMSRVRLKSLYLSLLHGSSRGQGRYLDYPTAYKLNTPENIAAYSDLFKSIDVWNVGPVSSAGLYAPQFFRFVVDALEKRRIARGQPRTDLVTRIVR